MSLAQTWRRVVGALRGTPQPSKAQLADELLATLSPMTLFDAGYPAHRRVHVYRRRVRYIRLRQGPTLDRH